MCRRLAFTRRWGNSSLQCSVVTTKGRGASGWWSGYGILQGSGQPPTRRDLAPNVSNTRLRSLLLRGPLHLWVMLPQVHLVCTDMPRSIALCFIVLQRCWVIYKLKVCDTPELSKSVGAIFPIVFAHSVSPCHALVTLAISQTFSLLLYVLW